MVHSCPICKVALTDKVYDRVAFLECSQCAGIWIIQADLKQLEYENVNDLVQIDLQNVPVKSANHLPTNALTCPKCSGDMEQFHFMVDTPIILNRCSDCEGLWIDDGELAQMAAAIQAAYQPPTTKELGLAKDVLVDAQLSNAAAINHYNNVTSFFKLLCTRTSMPWFF
jgi:Zn-finger nucleic acid-binding protein